MTCSTDSPFGQNLVDVFAPGVDILESDVFALRMHPLEPRDAELPEQDAPFVGKHVLKLQLRPEGA